MEDYIAVLCGDLHLSLTPPSARAAEPDWLDAQKRPFEQLKDIAGDRPILCAGDVFDRWNAPPELINWAITHLPNMFAVPGQHDLPYHNLDAIKKSAYWTLVEVGVLDHVDAPVGLNYCGKLFQVTPFPWGRELHGPKNKETLSVALCHRYVWTDQYHYFEAPPKDHCNNLSKDFLQFDVAVFGDNHKGFEAYKDGCVVYNCGGFQRRKKDEFFSKPAVGLLYADGKVKRLPLNCQEDQWIGEDDPLTGKALVDLSSFFDSLEELGCESFDYRAAINRWTAANEEDGAVCDLLLKALGG